MSVLCLCLLLFAVPSDAKPRLAIVISVDQMRADYLDRFATQWKGGFKRLREEAAVFAQARHLHVPTETGPGHAAILTGRFPDVHGIVGNEWYDLVSAATTYCAADSVHGLGPEHLLSYTLGDALKAADPAAKVVALSGKDRSAIFLGGKRPDLALWYDRAAGEFGTSSYYFRPRWLGSFNAGLKRKGGPLYGRDAKGLRHFIREPEADAVLLELVLKAADELDLGGDEHLDLLAVSFSAVDYAGHDHGIDSPAMRETLLALDGLLGRLLAALEKRAGKGRVLLALTADHGAIPEAEGPSGKALKVVRLPGQRLYESLEKALQYQFPSKEPWLVSASIPHLYLNRAQSRRVHPDWKVFLRQAAEVLRAAPHIAEVYVPDDIPDTDPYAEVFRRSVHPGRSGDLLFRVEEGVLVSWDPATDHGSPYDYDARVPLVFWGPAFKTARVSGPVAVADLAATLAHVLGLKFPTDGKVRSEILSPAP